ncbi:saccharopine dehydrogenase family protein [Paraliobacillus sp. JSM ZJ581]|uniref:saccharopine dehydrogenase family protein n=1 Tax=Paraliobacillus sp. JSM ZJ581 TaxID=3342118 RepID=UPI0035A9881A
MNDNILVVGGYGKVGKVVCTELGDAFPGKVIAAGRSMERATEFTSTTNGKVKPLAFDVTDHNVSENILKEVATVVMCMDQKDTQFVQKCLEQGVNYIDVTASYHFLSEIETFNNLAKVSKATAILSVGLSPGITNLLVQYSKMHFDSLDKADIYVMLGLGEKHGKAATTWMIENINTSFEVVESGALKRVKSFEDGRISLFPAQLGKRKAYRFNFPEQHVLPQTLNIKSIAYRICFDSKLATTLLAGLKKTGFFNLLKYKLVKSLFVWIFDVFKIGSDVFVAKVDSQGEKNGKKTKLEVSVVGQNQTMLTGQMGALITKYVYLNQTPAGIYHIEQIVNAQDVFNQLKKHVDFYVNGKTNKLD